MKKLNRKIFYILVVCVVFAIIGFSAALNNYSSELMNRDDHKDAVVHVYILKDSSFLEATKMLNQAGLVKNSFLFCSLAIIKGSNYHVRAGEYKFNTSMTPSEMIDKLMRGENKI
jgi:cell division protein YceG involved in septum cleavage